MTASSIGLTLVSVLMLASLFGPASSSESQAQTFHVSGAVRRAHDNSAIAGAGVIFAGNNIRKTVTTSQEGRYSVDLPVGTYTMSADPTGETASPVDRLLQIYTRPLFRATASDNITFDATIYLQRQACDLGVLASSAPNNEDYTNSCGGNLSFPVPAKDGTPFQVLIRFEKRRSTDRGYIYENGGSLRNIPVFVAYNLFTLQADQVFYDPQNRTLEATGSVLVTNEAGAMQRGDSMTFRIENGEATRLR